MRCPRCGHDAAERDKFCVECGMFLRDAFVDHRLLDAMVAEQEGTATTLLERARAFGHTHAV